MTSVFFFLAIRLGGLGGIQRESMEYQNQKAYLESYVEYLMSLAPAELELIKGDITFDGITGTITNEVDEIVGVLDAGEIKSYDFDDTIKIEWNLCDSNTIIENGELEIDKTIGASGNTCVSANTDYDGWLTATADPSISLESLGEPFHYRITSTTPSQKITDNFWHLSAEIDLGYGKKIKVEEVFIP